MEIKIWSAYYIIQATQSQIPFSKFIFSNSTRHNDIEIWFRDKLNWWGWRRKLVPCLTLFTSWETFSKRKHQPNQLWGIIPNEQKGSLLHQLPIRCSYKIWKQVGNTTLILEEKTTVTGNNNRKPPGAKKHSRTN